MIDYRVSMGVQGSGSYEVLASGILSEEYTTEVGVVTPGQTYSLVVESRNSAGFSLVSEPVSVLAAQLADAPSNPVTSTDMATIVIEWDKPFDGATAITSYTVLIR